ncbi:MAG: prephenate dehydratase [Pseudomonadota bacterium]
MSNEDKLQSIRQRIDALDEQIQDLINQRAACAEEVARIKNSSGAAVNYYRPEREAEVLRRVKARNRGPLSAEEMARLFREIMSACLALEQPMQIAFLGPEGTYTHAAALKHFGHSVNTVPMATIDEVFREVEAGTVHYGVVPVENSTEGVVTHTLDKFLSSPLNVCGEVLLRIHHQFLATQTDRSRIKKIYSHQQSLGQCREWLDANMPHAERIAVSSNAEAARLAAQDDTAAAIASTTAAEIYGLQILAANIEDQPDNTTRFLVIGRPTVPAGGHDKTSLLVSTGNRPGALFQLLSPLAEHGLSMTRIESRPSRQGLWEYVFFIDIEGHQADSKVALALEALKHKAVTLRILGSYPKAVI